MSERRVSIPFHHSSAAQAEEENVSLGAPTPADQARLDQRDELWLRVIHLYALQTQPDQVTFDAVDAAGATVANRSGMTQLHTWQVLPHDVCLFAGDRVYVHHHGDGVRTKLVPRAAAPPSAYLSPEADRSAYP
jgi:hypothetical protein